MFSHKYNRMCKNTLLALVTPALNGVVFRDMTLKTPAYMFVYKEFDREHLKNNANKDRR